MASGSIKLTTGEAINDETGGSGAICFRTGDTKAGQAGGIIFAVGRSGSGSGGDVILKAGEAPGGVGGTVSLAAGVGGTVKSSSHCSHVCVCFVS